ncbi:MAG: F0F1 ATP synthase subunit B [Anaerolineae bacterium]|nr:F0F1 ATP synthase subunit B [Anaerolineae bacterium]MDW8101296.1 F0F1 ATP synthase subunit B [Anaerolineae bacterium]
MEKLGVNLPGLVLQAINFLLLLFILQRFLYRPILNAIKTRQERIQRGLEEAEKASRRLAEAEAEAERILAEARAKAQEILAQASYEGNRLKEEIVAQARAEASRILERARLEAEREKAIAMAEIRHQAIDLAILTARKIVGQALDEKAQHRIISDFLSTLEQAD